MATKKVGALIKEARTGAGLTQEALAKKIKGLEARDISAAERGEKDLTAEQLKLIAKATGVTQKSLLDAAKGTGAAKTSGSAAKKNDDEKLTAAEKKLLTAYRKADKDTKAACLGLLKMEENEISKLLVKFLAMQSGGSSSSSSSSKPSSSAGKDILQSLLGGAAGFLVKDVPAASGLTREGGAGDTVDAAPTGDK